MGSRAVGIKGEVIAKEYLEKKGYRILETNYHTSYGEADIIAFYKNTVIFIEVKSRTATDYGNPSEAVNRVKIKKYIMLATDYMTKFKREYDVRFDIIEILAESVIEHIENAFDANDAAKYIKRY
ncbi:MAG: YraN family protein [Clostridia bacterium]|nr:YraN family protein [Clostridia bacterium]